MGGSTCTKDRRTLARNLVNEGDVCFSLTRYGTDLGLALWFQLFVGLNVQSFFWRFVMARWFHSCGAAAVDAPRRFSPILVSKRHARIDQCRIFDLPADLCGAVTMKDAKEADLMQRK